MSSLPRIIIILDSQNETTDQGQGQGKGGYHHHHPNSISLDYSSDTSPGTSPTGSQPTN